MPDFMNVAFYQPEYMIFWILRQQRSSFSRTLGAADVSICVDNIKKYYIMELNFIKWNFNNEVFV